MKRRRDGRVALAYLGDGATSAPDFHAALNFAGVLTAERLRSWWSGAILAVFLFCAIITPTPDPWKMTLLAIPILLLLLIAWVIAWWHDRRAAQARAGGEWSDDDDAPIREAEPLDAAEPVEAPSPVEPSPPPAD